MVQQNVRKGGVGLVVVKGGEVDASGFESGVRWCEHRERSFTLKGRHQFGVSEGSHEGTVDARSGGHAGDVFERRLLNRWEEYLVDDVNDAVAGSDVGGGDRGVVDHHRAVVDRERSVVAVGHRGDQAVANVGSVHGAVQHVIEQNVRKGGVGLVVVEGGQIDASGFKGGVRWCENRERAVALKGLNQPSVGEGSDQRIVGAGGGSVGWDVFGFVSRHTKRDGGKTEAGNHEER